MGEEGDKTLRKTLKKHKITLISQTLHGVAKMKKKPGRKSLSHTLNELARKRKMKNIRKSKQQKLGNYATMTIGIQKRQIPHSSENVVRTKMKKGTTPILHSLRNVAGRKAKAAKTTLQMPRKGVLMKKAEKVASIRMKARRVALIKTTKGLSASKKFKSVVSDVSISDNVEHIKEENSCCKKEDGDVPLSHDSKSPPTELDNGSEFLRKTANGVMSQVGKGYIPRSTRSQNPKFVEKQRSFLKKVHSMVNEDLDEESDSDTKEESKEPLITNINLEDAPKTNGDASPGLIEPNYDEDMAELRRRSLRKEITMVGKKDKFCWKCHKQEKEVLSCELCPRSYHLKCVLLRERPQEAWVCPECVLVTHADDEASRSTNMRMVTLKEQRKILHNVVKMMKDVKSADNFYDHVNTTEFPDYLQFIVKPMCISTLEKMVDNREIASTQGLLAETKWIHHNCVVYNGLNAGLTGVAKALKKICRDECIKIEICPECFLHNCRHGAKGFIRVCKRPHVPVWARMTGFPFWPAKAMGMKDGGVQVFFFADHNRAVVPTSEVFLYSQDIPFPNQRNSRKQRLEDAVEEMKQYLYQLMKKDYKLKLAPCQTRYDPNRDEEHRQMMLPNYVEWVPQKRPRTKIKAEKLPMHLKDRTNEDASTLMGNSMVHLNLESTHLDSSSSIDKSLMIAASKAKKKKLLQISKSPSSLGSDMKRRRKTVSPKPNSKDKVIPEGETAVNVILEKERMISILERENYNSEDFNCDSDKPLHVAKHCMKRKCKTDYGSNKSAKNEDTIKVSDEDMKQIMRKCEVVCVQIKEPKIFASEQTQIISPLKSKIFECSKPIVDDTSVDHNNDSSDCASNDNNTLSLSDTSAVILLSSSRNSTNSNEIVSEKNSPGLNNFVNGETSKIDNDINNLSNIKTLFDSVTTKTTVQAMSRVTGENCESLLLGASKPGLLAPSKEACPDSSAHKVLENSDKTFINGSFSIPKETSIDSGKKSPNVMLRGGVTSELSSEVKTALTASSSVDKEDITVHLKTTNNIKTSEKSDSGCRTAANDGDSNSMELIEIKKELIDECEMDGDILSPPSKDTALMVYSPMLEPKISLTVLNEQVHTDSPTTSSLMTERLLSMDPISKEISFALSPEVNLFLQPSTKISKHNNEVSSDSLGQQHLQIGSPPASPQLAIKKLSDKKMNQPGSSGAETANDTRVQLPPNGTDSQPLPNHANDPKLFPSLKIPLNIPSLLPNLLMNYYPAIANPKTPEDVKAGTMLNSLSYEVSSILIGLEAFQNKTRLPNGIPKKSKLHEYKDSILELLLRLVLYDNERNMNLQTSETVLYNYFYYTNLNPLTDQYCHTDRDKTKCSSLCKIIDEDIKSLSKECQRQVEDAKKKLWCSFCSKEAFLHCCLKAAYCSQHCQAQHWNHHYEVCTSSGHNTLNRKHPGLNPTPLSQVRADCEYDTGSPKGRWRNKRRRCGLCDGCLVLDNCGICSVCINPNTHQVCKLRQCSHLQHKRFNPSVDKLPPLLPAYTQPLSLPKTNGSIPGGSKKPRKKTALHNTHPNMRLRPHNVSNSNMMQIQSYEQPALHLSDQFEAMARHFNVLEAQRNIANNSGFGIQNGLVNHGAPNVSRPLRDNEGNYPNIHPGRSSDHWPNPYCVPHHNGRMFPSHQGPLILPPDNLNVQSFPNSHGPLNVCLPQEGGPNTSATLISSSSLVKQSSTKLSSSNTSTTLNHMERSMLNYLPSYPHPSMGHKPQNSLGSANQPTPNYGVPPHLSNTHQSMGSCPTLPNPQYSMELLPKLPNHNQSSGHLFHLPDPRQLMGHPIQNLKGP